MIKELDLVALTTPIPEHGLQPGDVGTVVLVVDHKEYIVEFMALDGSTIAVVGLPPDKVRPMTSRDMSHVRVMAAP